MGSRTQFKSGKPCLNWNRIAVLYNLWPKKTKNQGQSMVMFLWYSHKWINYTLQTCNNYTSANLQGTTIKEEQKYPS
jgi:hypothetical protein